jgi:hypothetical protein
MPLEGARGTWNRKPQQKMPRQIPCDDDLNPNSQPSVFIEECCDVPRPNMSADSAKWYAWGVALLVMFGVSIECGMWFTAILMIAGAGLLCYVGDHTSGRRTISRIFEIADEKYEYRKARKIKKEKEKSTDTMDQLLNKFKEEINKKVEKEAQEKTWAKVREELKKKLEEEEKKQSSTNP